MKSLEQIYTDILASKKLQQEFVQACKDKDVIGFLKKYDCDVVEEELNDFLKTKKSSLSDGELASVSGGCDRDEVVMSAMTVGIGCVVETLISKNEPEKKKDGYMCGGGK